MGIFNATPYRLSGGSEVTDISSALTRVCKMIDSNPEIIAIDGQSTQPSAEQVSLDVEIARVVPLTRTIGEAGIAIAIAGVVAKAIEAGGGYD